MRITRFIIAVIITAVLIFFLDNKWGMLPPFGRLLSPQQGFWQNAEAADEDFSGSLHFPQLQKTTEVWLDKRLVPHIFAENEHDLYFVQGYITAKFRLWQMELQIMAAAGRVAEILGPDALQFDRTQRRKGMLWAAENALHFMEKDTAMKKILDAYTAGVNAYISTLNRKTLPLEYKLLDYRPQQWTNLNSALLLKYMSDQLTGNVDDLEYSNMRTLFSDDELHRLFPDLPDSLSPVIPVGTPFIRPTVQMPQAPPDSLLPAGKTVAFSFDKPDINNGSNNWALSGNKTLSHAPILCNDPHLGLNLPSLWYEVQLQTPQMNVYGVSLPGAPAVIIGFNDHIAWGVTNAQRDVKDFYSIRFKDQHKQEYLYNGRYRKADLRVEKINIRGEKPFYDTVAYTVFGPVMYDNDFPDTITRHAYLAMHWQASQPSDELKTFYLLNHARNYEDYLQAISVYDCPAQNFVFASKSGDIAIWQQGKFPLRWKDQGKFIMPGTDSTFSWQGYIPSDENPHIENPERGFVSSANQRPTDSTYPYYYSGNFIYYRAYRINEVLGSRNLFTVQDMMRLQTDCYDGKAAAILPLMLRSLPDEEVQPGQRTYLDILRAWNYVDNPQSKAATIFYAWWDSLYNNIWEDELAQKIPVAYPTDQTTIEWLLRDSTMRFIDNIHTKAKETLSVQVLDAFNRAMAAVTTADKEGKLPWGIYHSTGIMHLARLPAFSRTHLFTGGSSATVNAINVNHGPSWRMVVQLGKKTAAYGIYPGGQSGNPGSRYYDNMVDDWVLGKYYPLLVFQKNDPHNANIKFKIVFSK